MMLLVDTLLYLWYYITPTPKSIKESKISIVKSEDKKKCTLNLIYADYIQWIIFIGVMYDWAFDRSRKGFNHCSVSKIK